MFFKLPLVVPFRFIASITHIIICAILLMNREWNLVGCGSSIFQNSTLLTQKDNQ
jgi:hypothetical protein